MLITVAISECPGPNWWQNQTELNVPRAPFPFILKGMVGIFLQIYLEARLLLSPVSHQAFNNELCTTSFIVSFHLNGFINTLCC